MRLEKLRRVNHPQSDCCRSGTPVGGCAKEYLEGWCQPDDVKAARSLGLVSKAAWPLRGQWTCIRSNGNIAKQATMTQSLKGYSGSCITEQPSQVVSWDGGHTETRLPTNNVGCLDEGGGGFGRLPEPTRPQTVLGWFFGIIPAADKRRCHGKWWLQLECAEAQFPERWRIG